MLVVVGFLMQLAWKVSFAHLMEGSRYRSTVVATARMIGEDRRFEPQPQPAGDRTRNPAESVLTPTATRVDAPLSAATASKVASLPAVHIGVKSRLGDPSQPFEFDSRYRLAGGGLALLPQAQARRIIQRALHQRIPSGARSASQGKPDPLSKPLDALRVDTPSFVSAAATDVVDLYTDWYRPLSPHGSPNDGSAAN